jgi:hypothetical protein
MFELWHGPLANQFMEFTSYFPLPPWGGRGQGEGGVLTDEATPHPVSSPRRGEGI